MLIVVGEGQTLKVLASDLKFIRAPQTMFENNSALEGRKLSKLLQIQK